MNELDATGVYSYDSAVSKIIAEDYNAIWLTISDCSDLVKSSLLRSYIKDTYGIDKDTPCVCSRCGNRGLSFCFVASNGVCDDCHYAKGEPFLGFIDQIMSDGQREHFFEDKMVNAVIDQRTIYISDVVNSLREKSINLDFGYIGAELDRLFYRTFSGVR